MLSGRNQGEWMRMDRSGQRRQLQVSLRALLAITTVVACGAAVFRVLGMAYLLAYLPLALGLIAGGAGEVISRRFGRTRSFPVIFGYGIGAALGLTVFDCLMPKPHVLRVHVAVSLLVGIAALLMWFQCRIRKHITMGEVAQKAKDAHGGKSEVQD